MGDVTKHMVSLYACNTSRHFAMSTAAPKTAGKGKADGVCRLSSFSVSIQRLDRSRTYGSCLKLPALVGKGENLVEDFGTK